MTHELDSAQPDGEERVRRLADRYRVERDRARAEAARLEADLERVTAVAELRVAPVEIPDWLTPRQPSGRGQATLLTILSDLHLDEVVRPSEVDWLNAYNRRIAEQRLERFFAHVPMIARDYLAGLDYAGIVVALGGDLISGSIHDELAQTNDATTAETIRYWCGRLAAGIRYLADEFGQVHVPVVVGNHGRFSRKPRAKLRALDNADWLIGQLIAERFIDDPRVTFDIPDGTDAHVRIYQTRFLLTHGDQTNGGGGIGGIWPPLMRLRARKLGRYQASGQPFDWLMMGHWHQLVSAQGLIVNGSLKGWDEYAAVSNFAPERAQQFLGAVTPEHGLTFTTPVFVDDRKAEGWARKRRSV